MLLRRVVVVACPLLLCLLTAFLFQRLDVLMEAGNFFLFVGKGLLLGVCIGLLLPVAGITLQNNGLVRWLYGAAGLLLLLLLYQYLENMRVVQWAALKALVSINGQVILLESAIVGFLVLTAAMHSKR